MKKYNCYSKDNSFSLEGEIPCNELVICIPVSSLKSFMDLKSFIKGDKSSELKNIFLIVPDKKLNT